MDSIVNLLLGAIDDTVQGYWIFYYISHGLAFLAAIVVLIVFLGLIKDLFKSVR